MGQVHRSYLGYALPALLALGAGWGVYGFAAARLPKLVYWVPGTWLIDGGQQVRSGLAVMGVSLLLASIAVMLVFIVVRWLGAKGRRATSG